MTAELFVKLGCAWSSVRRRFLGTLGADAVDGTDEYEENDGAKEEEADALASSKVWLPSCTSIEPEEECRVLS